MWIRHSDICKNLKLFRLLSLAIINFFNFFNFFKADGAKIIHILLCFKCITILWCFISVRTLRMFIHVYTQLLNTFQYISTYLLCFSHTYLIASVMKLNIYTFVNLYYDIYRYFYFLYYKIILMLVGSYISPNRTKRVINLF